MLHNPHRRVPSLESMAAWLETNDPQDQYQWSDRFNCACAQYAFARDIFHEWHHHGRLTSPEWDQLNRLAHAGQHTFGALLERVRQAQIEGA